MANANRTTIEILKKYDFPVQKKYGQNFLIDDNILECIVSAAEVASEDIVLEIGPGLGALTGCLAEKAEKVIAVEIDKMLIPILEETLSARHNVSVVNADIMKTDIEALLSENGVLQSRKIKVVANLPYYITTPVIMRLFEHSDRIKSITVMIQKEVAERIEAGPGSKSYGALSLAAGYYSKPKVMLNVSRNCFIPRPEVDSAVIKLEVYERSDRPADPKDKEKMFALIRAAFNQRRKTLVNAAGNAEGLSAGKEDIRNALKKLGISENIRGEALTLFEFAALSDEL